MLHARKSLGIFFNFDFIYCSITKKVKRKKSGTMIATKRDLTLQHSIKCAVNVSDQCTTLTLIVCSYIIHSRNFVLSMVYPMHNKYVRKQISIVQAMSTFISKNLKIPNRPFFPQSFFSSIFSAVFKQQEFQHSLQSLLNLMPLFDVENNGKQKNS